MNDMSDTCDVQGTRVFDLPLELTILDDGTYEGRIACLPNAVGRGATLEEANASLAASMTDEINKLSDAERAVFVEMETTLRR